MVFVSKQNEISLFLSYMFLGSKLRAKKRLEEVRMHTKLFKQAVGVVLLLLGLGYWQHIQLSIVKAQWSADVAFYP